MHRIASKQPKFPTALNYKSPRDGVVDPAGFCTALTRAATRAGAKVIENCAVTGIDTDTTLFGSRQVSAVHTDKGTIKTRCVVNCTGKADTKRDNNFYKQSLLKTFLMI